MKNKKEMHGDGVKEVLLEGKEKEKKKEEAKKTRKK